MKEHFYVKRVLCVCVLGGRGGGCVLESHKRKKKSTPSRFMESSLFPSWVFQSTPVSLSGKEDIMLDGRVNTLCEVTCPIAEVLKAPEDTACQNQRVELRQIF